jgi:RNase H-fold protein (predicted Holliday junction resolvase)
MADKDTYVEFAMETARDDVARHRSVFMNATVIDSQGQMVVIAATNLQTDNDKQGWFDLIKRKVAERHAQAVVITAPVTRAVYSPEGSEKFKQLLAAGIELRIDDACQLGLCEKVDSIMVSLYTPLQTVVHTQDYEYVNGKAVFGEKVRLDTNQGGSLTGRFTNFFDELAKAKPC